MKKHTNLTLQESMNMLSEMTLLDRFLFSEVMSDPEIYAAALQIILGQEELKLLTLPQAEKEVYYYTFVPSCKEEKGLELGDGAVRIFLNTRGKNDDEITPELREFLHYVEFGDDEFAEKCGSDRLKKIHACVNRIKSSEEAGVKFMQKWIERIEYLEKGREEGREEGVRNALYKLMQKQHMTAEEALDFLEVPDVERDKYLKQCG